MAIPTYLVGTGAGGSTAGGPYTPAWPTHQADDWGYLAIQSAPTNAIVVTPGGAETWTESSSSPQQSSTDGTNGTRLTVYRCLATGGSMPAPSVSNMSNNAWCVILRIRGAHTAASPVHTSAGGTAASNTAVSFPGVTTSVADCLILNFLARAFDAATAQFSGETNADLANLAEVYDLGTAGGNGGGIVIVAGDKATAGSVTNTTGTLANACEQAMITLAIMPPQAGFKAGWAARSNVMLQGGLAA